MTTTHDKISLTGLRGWCALMGFQLVIGTVKNFSEVITMQTEVVEPDVVRLIEQVPSYQYVLDAGAAADVARLGLLSVTTLAFFMKSRHFPRLFIAHWLTAPAVLAALVLMTWQTLAHRGATLADVARLMIVENPELNQIWAGMIAGGLWVLYLMHSRRVANTFVE